jgi:hypothetical protein
MAELKKNACSVSKAVFSCQQPEYDGENLSQFKKNGCSVFKDVVFCQEPEYVGNEHGG